MIHKWRQDEFLVHNAIFFVGSLAAGFFNYLFYPVLGRLLEPTYFGEVQTLFSLFSHVGAFMGVLGLVAVNIVANQRPGLAANRLIVELEKLTILVGLAGFVLLLLVLQPIADFFRFGSATPFVGIALAIIISVPITFRRAVLQGASDFSALSWANIIGALAKLALAAGLVSAGFKTGGPVLAVVIAQIATLIYIVWRLRRRHTGYTWPKQIFTWPKLAVVSPEFKYAGLVLSVSLIITIQYSIDILAVKHYFSPAQAGLYAGISTVANIIFFITGSVTGVLLASVRFGQRAANYQLLRRSFWLVGSVGGAALAVFALWPRGVISILLGGKYLDAAHYLPSISLAMFLVSVSNLCYIYFMAQRKYLISLFALAGAAVTYTLMLANHPSIQAIISNVIIGSAILLVLVAAYGYMNQSD